MQGEKQMFRVQEDGQGEARLYLTFEAATLMARLVEGKEAIIAADIGSRD